MSAADPVARGPSVAGLFYPAEADDLARTVDGLLLAAPRWEGPRPKALVLPHAGYRYSGPTAATGYASLAASRGLVDRIVLFGPAHRARLAGVAAPAVDVFLTPLGPVTVEPHLRHLAAAAGAVIDDRPHVAEHSLEVHLPFIQRVLPAVPVLPMVVGEAAPEAVAAIVEATWGDERTVTIVSSDLSHYLDYEEAQRTDRATAAAIVDGNWHALRVEDACGFFPLRGLLEVARRRALRVQQLDLRSSGDTAGDRDRVVGYGAFAFFEGAGGAP